MELPLRTIIVMIIVALVLVVLSFFISTSSGPQITQGDAQRVFSTMCQQYKPQGCPWSVTKESSFSQFLGACRTLYGDYRDKFSCLYSLCEACNDNSLKPTQPDIACAAIAESCEANQKLGVSTGACCANFRSTCTGVSVQAAACRT
jgi:hypothetical protein